VSQKFKRIVSQAWPTLPRRGKFAEYFPPNHGGRVFHRTARRHAFAAKKPRLAARKIARTLAAFSLPQDSQVELMFGAACFCEPTLSASRSLDFTSRRARSFAASPRYPSQVVQSATDFAPGETARLAAILKRLQRRAFSQAAARRRRRLAFGLPQRA
jgi:hypothetical protein